MELSAGLPVRKMYLRDSIIPFLTTLQQFGEDVFEIFTTVMGQITVLNERTQKGLFEDFLRINNLLRNSNEKFFLEKLKNCFIIFRSILQLQR